MIKYVVGTLGFILLVYILFRLAEENNGPILEGELRPDETIYIPVREE